MWICPKCEQTNQDSDSFCPLCGAAKTLKREAPVYGGAPVGEVRETPAPAPVKAAPTAVPGGAWGTVGDWRRDAKDKKEYEDAVAAASGPAAPQSAAAPQSVAAPKPAADTDDEETTRSMLKWMRIGILGTTFIIIICHGLTVIWNAGTSPLWYTLLSIACIFLPGAFLGRTAAGRALGAWTNWLGGLFGIFLALDVFDYSIFMGIITLLCYLARVLLCRWTRRLADDDA